VKKIQDQQNDLPRAYKKAENQLNTLLELFKTGDIEEEASKAFITPEEGDDRPIFDWSFRNRLMVMISGTRDARGYNQWQDVGRQVKEGAESIRILAPHTYRKTVEEESEIERLREKGYATEEEKTEEGVKFEIMNGYRAVPVFRVEDTKEMEDFDGEPYRPEEVDYTPKQEDLPELMPLAEKLGVYVEYEATRGRAYGSYSGDKIRLHTEEQQTFYHELAHRVDEELQGSLKAGQDPEQEACAELSAAVLTRLYEGEEAAQEAYSYEYLQNYSDRDMNAEDAYDLALKVIGRVEKILKYVIEKADEEQQIKAEAETFGVVQETVEG